MNGTYLASLLFLLTSALGTVYLVVEAVLQFLGKSICVSEGCKVVSQYTRFGDLSMVLLGLGVLALLTVLAARSMRSSGAGSDRLIDVVLVAALAGEGFLAGYQLFHLHTVCIFCLSVLGIYIVMGVLRIAAGHRGAAAGFGALLVVLGLVYLVLPSGSALPLDGKYILFFSPDCKHCQEIRTEMERQGIGVVDVEVKEHATTLKNLGIEHVPTLMVNGPYEKIFLTGTDAIRRYLAACKSAQPPAAGITSRPRSPLSPSEKSAPSGTLNLFSPLGTPGQIFNPPPDEGLCKENAKCE